MVVISIKVVNNNDLYSAVRNSIALSNAEMWLRIKNILNRIFGKDFIKKKYLDIGCGNGSYLNKFLSMRIEPELLYGNELMENRILEARRRLPDSVQLFPGNFLDIPYETSFFDCISLMTVFSSILNLDLQKSFVERIKALLKPGGICIIYDFVYDNPYNKDVKGISVKRLRQWFQPSRWGCKRVTLCPLIARRLEQFPCLQRFLYLFAPLKTHVVVWFQK
jgi:SAM-dependent methyltransferase